MIMAVRRVRVRLCSTAVYCIVKSKRGDSFIVELGYLCILQHWCVRSSELKITNNIQS